MSDNVFNPEGESAIRSRAYADRLDQTGQCPKCGRPLSATAPEGLCPHCLLRSVVGKRQPAPPTDLPPPLPGLSRRVGDYELLQELGRGGMGVVYKARQTKLGREVALKLMLLGQMAGEKAKERVRHEAQIAARLQHPNIVAVYDVGEHEGAPYIAMEYVEGRTLDQMAKVAAFKPGQAAELIRSLALAIHYAHQQGVVHRDLKPSNVMIDATQRPRITDFGLAKHLESDLGLTVSGETFGTPSFMSPEQAKPKRGQIGPATDVYSLGGILYYLLSGRPPFCADTRDEVLRQALHDEPVAPRRLNPSIPHDLQTICLKCLDKNPHRRYATAEELADDLGRFQRKEPIHAKPAHLGTKLRRWCQRQPRVAALLGALLLISALAVFLFLAAMGGVVVNWQRAEQNAKEQKRLREIAEEALRNLDNETASMYRTSGVFRFKLPPYFIESSGSDLGVLKQAMANDVTIAESQNGTKILRDSFEQTLRLGGFAVQEGSEDNKISRLLDYEVFEIASGKARILLMTLLDPRPLSENDVEHSFAERAAYINKSSALFERFAQVSKPGLGVSPDEWQKELTNLAGQFSTSSGQTPPSPISKTVCAVKSGFAIGGKPAVMLDCKLTVSKFRYRTFTVFVNEQPRVRHLISIYQYENQDEDVIQAFVESIQTILPDIAK